MPAWSPYQPQAATNLPRFTSIFEVRKRHRPAPDADATRGGAREREKTKMTRALQFLRNLTAKREVQPETDTAFDARLQKLDAVRQVTVSRAVLFRTQPAQQEA